MGSSPLVCPIWREREECGVFFLGSLKILPDDDDVVGAFSLALLRLRRDLPLPTMCYWQGALSLL